MTGLEPLETKARPQELIDAHEKHEVPYARAIREATEPRRDTPVEAPHAEVAPVARVKGV